MKPRPPVMSTRLPRNCSDELRLDHRFASPNMKLWMSSATGNSFRICRPCLSATRVRSDAVEV